MEGDLYHYMDDLAPSIKVSVNGTTMDVPIKEGYLTLEKENWQRNDKIDITFDMPIRKVATDERVAANRGKIALERGPLVFCLEEVDNPKGVLKSVVPETDKFEYVFDGNLLGGIGDDQRNDPDRRSLFRMGT